MLSAPMVAGKPMESWTLSMACVACPREIPGARLNEIVTDGNWPWGFTAKGMLEGVKCVKAGSGIGAPLLERK